MPIVRRGEPGDLVAIQAIQTASPQAAQWSPADYLHHDLSVAIAANRIAGFLVARQTAADEWEILNLAVAPECRQQGVARALISAFLEKSHGAVFLEVRASNEAARNLYRSMGFEEVNVRPGYYLSPQESGIVMKFHSC